MLKFGSPPCKDFYKLIQVVAPRAFQVPTKNGTFQRIQPDETYLSYRYEADWRTSVEVTPHPSAGS